MKRDGFSRRTWSGAWLAGHGAVDIAVAEGRIAALEPAADARRHGRGDLDVAGFAVLPRLVEAHVHLDKTLFRAPWQPHVPGDTIAERVAAERSVLASPELPPLSERADALLDRLLRNGATAVRSHVDVSSGGLAALDTLLALRKQWSDRVDIQFVAFPQAGILRTESTASALDGALAAGCEVIGGLDPETFDGDRAAHLEVVFRLALSHDARVDIHLHERGEVGAASIELICELVRSAGLAEKVAISHGFALADLHDHDRHRFDDLSQRLAAARVAIITSLPGGDVRFPLGALLARGVRVAVGSDNVRDAWSPFGKADPLERAGLAAYLEDWRDDARLLASLDLVSAQPAHVLGLEAPKIEVGARADLVFARAGSTEEAIVDQPEARVVVREGRIVSGGWHLGLSAAPESPSPGTRR